METLVNIKHFSGRSGAGAGRKCYGLIRPDLSELPQVRMQQAYRLCVIIVMKQLSLAELIWITSCLRYHDSLNEEAFNIYPQVAPGLGFRVGKHILIALEIIYLPYLAVYERKKNLISFSVIKSSQFSFCALFSSSLSQ